MSVKIRIITCSEWEAKHPKEPITVIGRAPGIIFHHTAGHHRELDRDFRITTVAEAKQYARDIQAAHMAPGGLGSPTGGIDSGHNFLVLRNGMILQGRWLTVSAIESGHMVASAHAGSAKYNAWIGIEHEHKGNEPMTKVQHDASATLQAWIAEQYNLPLVLPVDPHSAHYNTACPGNLYTNILGIKMKAQRILDGEKV